MTPSPVIPPENTIVQKRSVVPDTASDTICLDSDEEETTVHPPSKTRELVAVNSTAKHQEPVPVQLTAAKPVNPGPPRIIPESIPTIQTGVISLGNPQTIGQNFVVIPASQAGKLTKLSQCVPSNVKNISRFNVGPQNSAVSMQRLSNVNLLSPRSDGLLNANNVILNQMPLNLNLANQIPQNVNMLNQNLNLIPQTPPFTLQSQNTNFSMPQNMNITGSMPINVTALPQMSSPIESIDLSSITNTGTSTQNGSSSESILPTLPSKTLPKPGPASSKAKNKTVCKPGDILRITKTGQVEILNRDESNAVVAQSKAKTSTKQTKDLQTTVALTDDEEPVRVSSKSNKIEHKKKKTKRSRKISSSSSSSSNSSRPSSPNDPLSILKDVVHIQASEDPVPVENTPTKSSEKIIGSTSIKKSASSTSSKTTRSSDDSTKAKKDKILEQINKTNTVLMKLNDVFGPAPERKAKNPNIGKIDSIDLTDAAPTSTVLDKLSKDIKIGKTPNNTCTKIIGTSKNIILTGNGKAEVASVENQ